MQPAVLCVLTLLLTGLSGATTLVRKSDEGGLDLLILHTNDMHCRFEQTNRYSGRCSPDQAARGECFGGYARTATLVHRARDEARAGSGPPVVVLNAGDNFQGSVYYTFFKWRMAAAFTNLIQFDALSLGNHEFDDGVAGLVPYLQNMSSPVVTANMDVSDEPDLKGLVKDYVVLDVNGTKVGVIGYITTDTSFLAAPGKVKFLDEIEVITKQAKLLKEEGVNIIIALGHSGYAMDQKIAEHVPDVDIVIGGHSHSFLYTGHQPDVDVPVGLYPTFVRQPSGREVPVVQAYAYTKYMGRLRVAFDAEGEILSRDAVRGEPVLLNSDIPEDPDVLRELNVWKAHLDGELSKPVGRTLVTLDSSDCRQKECNLGNLITDAFVFKWAKRYNGSGWTDAPIGVQNGGNMRTTIVDSNTAGPITWQDVLEVLPFGNNNAMLKVNGSIVLEMLEHSVSGYDPTGRDRKGGFLQVSGLRVTYDVTAPSGHRVVSVLARCGNCSVPAYYPLEPAKVYGMVINDFLVTGGDGYYMLANHESMTALDQTQADDLAEYFKEMSPVYPELQDRLRFVNSVPASSSSGLIPSWLQINLFLVIVYKYFLLDEINLY